MHDRLFYKYYDVIYSGKDYKGEANSILEIYRSIIGRYPQRVIDVGCGTGNHSCHFAGAGCSVVGTDIDAEEIALASKKALSMPDPKPQFHCVDIADLDDGGFDLAVSLFNVVSYIHGMASLIAFVAAIRKRVRTEGLFIFDCWNGVAAMTDPPQLKRTTVQSGHETIEVDTIPTIDLMRQTVSMRNRVQVFEGSISTGRFEYLYDQFLWTPVALSEILAVAGFRVLSINPAMNPLEKATARSWKIMFVCRAL